MYKKCGTLSKCSREVQTLNAKHCSIQPLSGPVLIKYRTELSRAGGKKQTPLSPMCGVLEMLLMIFWEEERRRLGGIWRPPKRSNERDDERDERGQ